MSKPKDVPQRVWDLAKSLPIISENFDDDDLMIVARAVLAAEQRERETIREIVATAPLSNRSDEPAISNKIMADWIDAQIANRGSEND